jgi:hypothetical protein
VRPGTKGVRAPAMTDQQKHTKSKKATSVTGDSDDPPGASRGAHG